LEGICSTALRGDGKVITWGDPEYGGDSSKVADKLHNVKAIFSTAKAFAALKDDGTVITWGSFWDGGNSLTVQNKLHNVKTIFSTNSAFAALKDDSTVVTWGDPNHGGDSSNVQDKLYNVKTIFSTIGAFAALKDDGTVVTWGEFWGRGDSLEVQDKLHNVKTIFSTWSAFAAIRKDGKIITWGSPISGGDSSKVQDKLHNVKTIFSTGGAFAALRNDGTVVTWGDPKHGGDSSFIASELKNVKCIFPMYNIPRNLDFKGLESSSEGSYSSSSIQSSSSAESPYLTALKSYLLQKREFTINGYFYKYDFDKDGRIDYNDWIYISPKFRAYRLLGITPTQKNVFGFKPIPIPDELDTTKLSGYFIYLGRFPQDVESNWKFSWLYIDTRKRVYKLMGATSDNRFKYLDVDKDRMVDNILNFLPSLKLRFEGNVEGLGYSKVIFYE